MASQNHLPQDAPQHHVADPQRVRMPPLRANIPGMAGGEMNEDRIRALGWGVALDEPIELTPEQTSTTRQQGRTAQRAAHTAALGLSPRQRSPTPTQQEYVRIEEWMAEYEAKNQALREVDDSRAKWITQTAEERSRADNWRNAAVALGAMLVIIAIAEVLR